MPTQEPTIQTPPPNKKGLIYSIIGVIAVIAAIAGFSMRSGDKQADQQPTTPSPTPEPTDGMQTEPTPTPVPEPAPTSTEPSPAAKSSYKDGTYTADGDYTYHSGSESITITVTLKNDVIIDSQFASVPKAPMSARYMGFFESGYKALIVGKNIDEVNLTKVSGSSRTPIGFNDALAKIKAEAKI